jgi:hypothetical protein
MDPSTHGLRDQIEPSTHGLRDQIEPSTHGFEIDSNWYHEWTLEFVPRGDRRGQSVTSLSSAWCRAACCLLCCSASFQFEGSTPTYGLRDQIDPKPMGWFIRSISNPGRETMG